LTCGGSRLCCWFFEDALPGVVFLFLAIGAAAAGFVLLAPQTCSLELQLLLFAVVDVASAIRDAEECAKAQEEEKRPQPSKPRDSHWSERSS